MTNGPWASAAEGQPAHARDHRRTTTTNTDTRRVGTHMGQRFRERCCHDGAKHSGTLATRKPGDDEGPNGSLPRNPRSQTTPGTPSQTLPGTREMGSGPLIQKGTNPLLFLY